MWNKLFAAGVLLAFVAAPSDGAAAQRSREAQERAERALEEMQRRGPGALAWAFSTEDRNRPRIGVLTESGGLGDTLGLLISEVTPDGPAAKAGLKAGDRLQSVNGVNLRISAADARAGDMEGVALRRLIRTLGRADVGDEVALGVWSDGAARTVRVKTASVEELSGARTRVERTVARDNRAVIGVGLGASGSRRDTLGVFIASVVPDGPAEKAGIIEGDRIQSVNGVDLRVPREDAGDWAMSSARAQRLTRELEGLKPGDDVELRVWSGGSVKTVRLKAVPANELQGMRFFFGDMPRVFEFPRGVVLPRTPQLRGELRPQLAPVIRERVRIAGSA